MAAPVRGQAATPGRSDAASRSSRNAFAACRSVSKTSRIARQASGVDHVHGQHVDHEPAESIARARRRGEERDEHHDEDAQPHPAVSRPSDQDLAHLNRSWLSERSTGGIDHVDGIVGPRKPVRPRKISC